MKEPKIKKYPTEILGHSFTEHSDTAKKDIETQYCKFICNTCTKPRKSEPHIKVGVCSLGYKGSFTKDYLPVIIFPHILLEDEFFNSIIEKYLSIWEEI